MKQIFYAAQEIETKDRASFLVEKCDGDDELKEAVERLLKSSEKLEGFIEKPAFAMMADILTDDSITNEKGKHIGHYQIIRKVGQGGMGAVYLATRADDVYQKQVAIKLVSNGLDNEELLKRFRNERQILARLDHPNIAKLLDGGTTDNGVPYYVMDYIEGLPLIEYCDKQNLSMIERLKLFRQVCAAVSYAHQNLVIHRDLKPSNILVTKDGTLKLLDFGIAKVLQQEGQTEQTVTNLQVMTPEYASPEQIRGLPVTTATDVYSLGVILYQLLTGHRPYRFKTHSPQDIAQAICEEEAERPSSVVRRPSQTVSDDGSNDNGQRATNDRQKTNRQSAIGNRQLKGDIDNIVLMALRKEPERRYVTVNQLSEDIRRHLEGLPVIARADTFTYRASKFVKRNKIGVAVAVGVLLLMIAGVIAIARQASIAKNQARIAAEQRDRAQREQAKATRINKFFQEMLSYANPSWYAPGHNKPRDLTVIAALDEAAKRIENDLKEEPEVKAEILMTIGDTYASIGHHEQSERCLELALKLRREVYGEDDTKVADALYFLANTKRALGNMEEMQQLYNQANAIYRLHPTEAESQLPYFLLDYAAHFSTKNNHAEAVRLTREAVDILRHKKGDTHEAVAVARENLAVVYMLWGDIDNALAELQIAVKLEQPPFTMTIFRLGEAYRQKGDLQKAEELLLESESRFGKEQNEVWRANALSSLADLYQTKGERKKAEDFIARAVAIDRRSFAPNHPMLLRRLIVQGVLITRCGDARRGETIIRGALKFLSEEQKESDWSLLNLGECLLAQKRYKEAEPLLLKGYQKAKGTQHPSSPVLKTARELLGKLYQETGRSVPPALMGG